MVQAGHASEAPPVAQGPSGAAFYDPPSSIQPGKHGDLIWVAPITSGVPNSKAWKILYWSTTVNNETVPVSGLLIAPATTEGPADGRPVVTWGHGTSGVPRNCAPSLFDNPARDAAFYLLADSPVDIDYGIPGLSQMIAAGYVVVATDYNGLGAKGVHHYLISDTEGRNVLDAALAARHVPEAMAGERGVVMGWSQGGQAAVWAAQIADYVAPSEKILGAVALAPVNAGEQIKAMESVLASGKPISEMQAVERLMAWYAMTNAYPELKLSDVLTPVGLEYSAEAFKGGQCNHHMGDTYVYTESYKGKIARDQPANQEAWLKRIEANSLGNATAKVPVAVYQGEEDLAVAPAATTAYVQKACDSGAKVSFTRYEGTDHIRLSAKAQPDFLAWIADRFAGKPAPTNCR
jgi:pimeloyl-ACP methyl ester carboxylesterase